MTTDVGLLARESGVEVTTVLVTCNSIKRLVSDSGLLNRKESMDTDVRKLKQSRYTIQKPSFHNQYKIYLF